VSERAALIAAALVTVNPLLVWYSQEARAYALLVLLAHPRDAVRRPPPPLAVGAVLRARPGHALLRAFVVGPLALWLVARHPDRRRAVAATAAVGATGLALLPLAIDQSENPGSNFITGTALGTRLLQVPKQFLLGYDAPAEAVFTTLAAGLAVAGGWLAFTRAREQATAAAALAGAAVLLALAAAAGRCRLRDRAQPRRRARADDRGRGRGLRRAGRARRGTGSRLVALSLTTVLAVLVRPEFQRDDWRGAADAIGPARGERALVVNPVAGAVALRVVPRRPRAVRRALPAGGRDRARGGHRARARARRRARHGPEPADPRLRGRGAPRRTTRSPSSACAP
jgi:hypothetical protein